MPEMIPRRDDSTGELVKVPHYDTAELADLLHVSVTHVRRQTARPTPAWPHLRLANRIWFSPDHVERILELSTVDPDAIPVGTDLPRLGVPLTDRDLEGVR